MGAVGMEQTDCQTGRLLGQGRTREASLGGGRTQWDMGPDRSERNEAASEEA